MSEHPLTDNPLGEFLRARRSGVRPGDVGMVSHGVRRVAGLRREEVAVLAGVNVDYYTRLEQGRERHPSAPVLDALADTFRLDADARAHLHRLAGTTPGRRTAPAGDRVSPALRRLMDAYPGAPAFVVDGALDVLACNALAEALHAPFAPADNLARMAFLDPAGRSFYADRERTARAVVGHLRLTAGLDPDSARLRDLVRELSARSAEFTHWWNAHEVRGKTLDAKQLLHPEVGALSLTYQAFDVRDAPGQQLVVHQAEPGSPSAEALGLLGSLHAAPARPPVERSPEP